jgi:hypothetical protein
VRDRHTLSRATRIDDTDAWLRSHGATYRPAIVIKQPGQPDLTVCIGETLIWDGTGISVEPREKP